MSTPTTQIELLQTRLAQAVAVIALLQGEVHQADAGAASLRPDVLADALWTLQDLVTQARDAAAALEGPAA